MAGRQNYRKNIAKALCALMAAACFFTGAVGAADVKAGAFKVYAEDELCEVIISVKGEAVLAADGAALQGTDFLESEEGEEMTDVLLSNQKRVRNYIISLYSDFEEEYTYTAVLNGFSCRLPVSLIDDVEQFPWVEKVYRTQRHYLPELYEAPSVAEIPQFSLSTGLTGEGEVIAIIDTELDVSHSMFSAIDGKNNRLTRQDVKNIVNKGLNANVYSDCAYVSSKLPFVCSYTGSDVYNTYDPEGYHGTHVSGIAAGNRVYDLEGAALSGVAPDAQIVFMGVFENNGGEYTAGDAQITAAIEDAVKLGATAVNLSLGHSTDFPEDELYKNAFAAAENAGVAVCAAAGNDDDTNTAYPELLNSSTINHPSSNSFVFSVASADNGYMMLTTLTLADGRSIGCTDNYFETYTDTLGGQTLWYTYCGEGSEEDFAAVDVSGKLALCDKGGTDIGQKCYNAYMAGAKGIIICDDVDEKLYYIMGDYLPTAFVTRADGEKLKNAQIKRITVSSSFGDRFTVDPVMSDYSSRGVGISLTLKPDITGIGGGVASAAYYSLFSTLSGTSMATPFVTGCCALAAQYLKQNGGAASGSERLAQMKNMLMCSAVPLRENGLLVTPRKQGAGLINMNNLLSDKVLLYGSDNTAKIQLYDGLGESFGFDVRVKNISPQAVTFGSAVLELTTDGVAFEDGSNVLKGEQRLNAQVSGLDGLKTVPANSERTVHINVTLDSEQVAALGSDFTSGFFIDGFILLSGASNCCDISVPLLGFYGDWSAVPIFCSDWAEDSNHNGRSAVMTSVNGFDIPAEISFARLAVAVDEIYRAIDRRIEGGDQEVVRRDDKTTESLRKYFGDMVDLVDSSVLEGVIAGGVYVSPDSDSLGDEAFYSAEVSRGATINGPDIFDKNGTPVSENHFDLQSERGSIGLYTGGIYGLPAGDYTARVFAQIDYPNAAVQEKTFEFTVDPDPPKINSANLNNSGGKQILTLSVSDKNIDGIYVIGYGSGGVVGSQNTSGLNTYVMTDIFSSFDGNSTGFYDGSSGDIYKLFAKGSDYYNFFDVVPVSGTSYTLKYDVTNLSSYYFIAVDRAYNYAVYRASGLYMGKLERPPVTKAGTKINAAAPEVIGSGITSSGWQLSGDGENFYDIDINSPVGADTNGSYLRYYVRTANSFYYSNAVQIAVVPVYSDKTTVLVDDGFFFSYYLVEGSSFELSRLPYEGYYTLTALGEGKVPKTMYVNPKAGGAVDISLAAAGDVNLDGQIDYIDISMMISFISGEISLGEYSRAVADVDGSRSIDYIDLSMLISYIGGGITVKSPY